MKKRTIFRTAWAVVSLALIAFVCVEWHKQGCGVWSLVAAVSFYGVLSAGLMIAVEDAVDIDKLKDEFEKEQQKQ